MYCMFLSQSTYFVLGCLFFSYLSFVYTVAFVIKDIGEYKTEGLNKKYKLKINEGNILGK